MSDEMIDRLRLSLAIERQQAEAVRFITERDERIKHLEGLVDALNHELKAARFEISARSAAALVQAELITELKRESAKEAALIAELRSRQSKIDVSADCPNGKKNRDQESPAATGYAETVTKPEAVGAPRSENRDVGGLISELLSDKCMIPSSGLPGIYEYAIRPLSKRAAEAIAQLEGSLAALRRELEV